MRKIIKGIVYQDGGMSGSDRAMIEGEAKRLYPGKKTIVAKGLYNQYYIWVPIGPAKGVNTDPDALMLSEFKKKLPAFRELAKEFNDGMPTAMRKAYNTSAKLYAAQLLDELGPKARTKKAWRQLFSGKIQVGFVETPVGTVGIAYTGKLTKDDRGLIEMWAEE